MRTPLYNGVLQSDLDGAGKRIGNPTPLSGLDIQFKTVREICLGIRTGDAPGSGSWDDPYDASTAAKHDEIWRTKIAPVPGTIVRYRDGIFLTTGSAFLNADNGFFIPAGVRVIGAGMYETTLRLESYPVLAGTNGHFVLETSGMVDGAGAEVSDLTVDANWQNLGAASDTMAGGVRLTGNNCRIVRVRCINTYGNLAAFIPAKALIITTHSLGAFPQTCANALIYDCLVELFRGDMGTAISMTGSEVGAPAGVINGGKAQHNIVRNWLGTALRGQGLRLEFLDNVVIDTSYGLIVQTGNFDDCRISRNRFTRATKFGIGVEPIFGTLSVQNLVIEDNFIDLLRNDDSAFVGINVFGQADDVVRNARVSRNTIIARGPPGIGGNVGIHATRVNGLVIEGNVENDIENNIIEANCTAVTVHDNFDEAGAHPVNLSDFSSVTVNAPEVANLFNTLFSSATRTIDGGYWAHNIPFADYVIQSGDSLQLEVFDDHADASHFAHMTLLTDIAGHVVLGATTMKDQNLLIGYADLAAYADDRWYFRNFSLEAYVGTTIKAFEFGGSNVDENGNLAAAGGSKYFWRNVRIVGSDTGIRRRIYTESTLSGAISSPALSADATNIVATAAWPSLLFSANTDTGWTADTGTAEKGVHAAYVAASISNPPTQAQVQAIANAVQANSRSIKALKDALIARGILSA